MNIELKPIAESKVRQLGGDVCGVLVRTEDSEVMAVSEHGRCTRLDGGVMGPVDGAQGGQGAKPIGFTWDAGRFGRQFTADAGVADRVRVDGVAVSPVYTQPQPDRAQGGQGAEPVAEIVHDYNGISVQWLEPAKYGRFQSGQKLYTQPQAAMPEGWLVRRVDDRITVQHPDIGGYCASKDGNDHSAIAPVILYHFASALLSTPTTPQADGCPECGSTDLTWHTQSSVTTGTPDGKLRANEVSTLFVLGCGHCSETIKTLTADQVAENMSPQPPARQEGA